jgi:hypothetical protein
METFFDSRVDLLQRRLQERTDRLRVRAEGVIKESLKIRTPGGEVLGENLDKEMQKLKMKVRQLLGRA